MEIKSISIRDFLCYYGYNLLEFSEKANLVIGQNNTGKSKLFDAFNWCLYDRAYHTTSQQWLDTGNWKGKLVNQRAAGELEPGTSLEAKVVVVLEDDQWTKYEVERALALYADENGAPRSAASSELSVVRTEGKTGNTKSYSATEGQQLIERMMPENLSRYFFFQGESISQIMHLGDKSAFYRALSDLSRIELFKMVDRTAHNVANRLRREWEDKQAKDTEHRRRYEELESRLGETEAKAESIRSELDDLRGERAVLAGKLEEVNQSLETETTLRDQLSELRELRSQADAARHDISLITEQQSKLAFYTMPFFGAERLFQKFSALYREAKHERKFPEPLRQGFVQEMLTDEECKVCGRSAPEGSDEYRRIAQHLQEPSDEERNEVLSRLAYSADRFPQAAKREYDEMSELIQKEADAESHLSRLEASIEKLRDSISGEHGAGIDELQDRVERMEDERTKWAKLDRQLRDIDAQINGRGAVLAEKEEEASKTKEQLDSFVNSSADSLERTKYQLGQRVHHITGKLYQAFLEDLVETIQRRAEQAFRSMTELNEAQSGYVKVDYAQQEVYITNDRGERQENINQANRVSLQLAFISAMLQVSSEYWEDSFPFVADAPISALGGNNKLAAIGTMVNSFEQSIIILKDDLMIEAGKTDVSSDPVRRMALNDDQIPVVYELRMHGSDFDNQYTEVRRLK